MLNKRIEQLADQCWNNFYIGDYEVKAPHAFARRFAKMIINECIGCCEQVISDPVPESVDTWLNGGSQCIAEIKHHFGVEE